LRPATARFVIAESPDEPDDGRFDLAETTRWRSVTDLDPGWVLSRSREAGPVDPHSLVADRPWWPATSRDGADALVHLWRHSVAVSLAAGRLAREAGDPDPDRIARAGLLRGLGCWVVAALDPDWLARWLSARDPGDRRAIELRDLGCESDDLGRDLAERWGCDPLIADAAWLHSDPDQGLEHAADEPGRLALLRRAFQLAERTPWSLAGTDPRLLGQHDPRVKLLTAEVQSRCGGPFLDTDATPREERLTRANARLRLRVVDLAAGQATRDRLLTALAGSEPTDDPEAWADRAGLAWCGEAGVSAARVVWGESDPIASPPSVAEPSRSLPGPGVPPHQRPPSLEVPLTAKGRTLATVQVWTGEAGPCRNLPCASTRAAWEAWGALVADRARLEARLTQVHRAYRRQSESAEVGLRSAKLDALAEFAAGAGHELNNPLAVIVGRAQLLLVHETDPKAVRSLRAILTQAQRAHRILRDLMYVARPPEPRPRFCQPDEIVRASVRDARPDAEDREIRIAADSLDHGLRVWADPDGLRHLADVLLRNALEATSKGGQVRFSTAGSASDLRWAVQDTGRGITPAEGGHLFDPFFCGRQAGRGLGMGLPRAARFLNQTGGEVRWHSTPSQGSTFLVRLPLAEPPKPLHPTADEPPAAVPAAKGVSASA
jgi:signal transduction histidine kinase